MSRKSSTTNNSATLSTEEIFGTPVTPGTGSADLGDTTGHMEEGEQLLEEGATRTYVTPGVLHLYCPNQYNNGMMSKAVLHSPNQANVLVEKVAKDGITKYIGNALPAMRFHFQYASPEEMSEFTQLVSALIDMLSGKRIVSLYSVKNPKGSHDYYRPDYIAKRDITYRDGKRIVLANGTALNGTPAGFVGWACYKRAGSSGVAARVENGIAISLVDGHKVGPTELTGIVWVDADNNIYKSQSETSGSLYFVEPVSVQLSKQLDYEREFWMGASLYVSGLDRQVHQAARVRAAQINEKYARFVMTDSQTGQPVYYPVQSLLEKWSGYINNGEEGFKALNQARKDGLAKIDRTKDSSTIYHAEKKTMKETGEVPVIDSVPAHKTCAAGEWLVDGKIVLAKVPSGCKLLLMEGDSRTGEKVQLGLSTTPIRIASFRNRKDASYTVTM